MDKYLKSTIETYNSISKIYVDMTSKIRPQNEFNKFINHVSKQGCILDVGSAWGRDTNEFDKQGFFSIGYDLSLGMLLLGKEKFPDLSLTNGDLRKMPFKNDQFSGLWCVATLLHLKRIEIKNALLEFYRVLAPNGVGYLQIKNGIGEEFVSSKFSQGKYRFFTYFEIGEFNNYCIDAGFEILDSYVYNELDKFGPGSRDQLHVCVFIRKGK